MKLFLFLVAFLASFSAFSMVQYNQFTGYWEGNICANYATWGMVPFQPVGSYCQFMLPNGMIMQGQIINR